MSLYRIIKLRPSKFPRKETEVCLIPETSILSQSINISLRGYTSKEIFLFKRNRFLNDNQCYVLKARGECRLYDGEWCEIIEMQPDYPLPKQKDHTYGCRNIYSELDKALLVLL